MGALLKTLEGQSDWVMSVVFSPDGTRIASGYDGWTIQLWDAVSGDCIDTRHNNSRSVSTAEFSFSDDDIPRTWGTMAG